ncbi:hypothetical protein C7974DRAFT_407190 [Boeremia exigua]|uniref:uncharacterized protein n=1 Tax=Boeremia exigua TaxID=749465 RepID=UPI001E8E308C|nr:uncharacterized protein C7974DRAFT_407190 [Boeremia exigua]KAH6611688.1 hypothetical protein C7974DRAFT_407190 [Boeremia exigua]
MRRQHARTEVVHDRTTTLRNNMSISHELIRNTIAQVAVAIDQKDWRFLETLFTNNTTVIFPAPIGSHTSFNSFQESLQGILQNISTQHSLTTQIINLGTNSAKVTTYVTTVICGDEAGTTSTSSGIYEDELVKIDSNGQERWRVVKRKASSFP